MAGLDCTTLDVVAKPGGATENLEVNHRINMIRLDGEYYFVEVFWFYQKTSPEEGDYRYMNMTTAQAECIAGQQNRRWDLWSAAILPIRWMRRREN